MHRDPVLLGHVTAEADEVEGGEAPHGHGQIDALAGNVLLVPDICKYFKDSTWQKSQVRRFSDCCSPDFGSRLPANQLYNNNKIDELETLASDTSNCGVHSII